MKIVIFMVVRALNFQHSSGDVETALIQLLIYTRSLHKFFISRNDIWESSGDIRREHIHIDIHFQ